MIIKSAVDSWYLRCDSLKEIGKAFKIEKRRAAINIVEKMKKEIRKNNIFKKRAENEKLIAKPDKSQRQTWPPLQKNKRRKQVN